MKDSSKLLNFNVNRNLKFKVFRGVDFDVRRNLAFDSNRDLFFDVNRDLGFGKRGVVFRGYVCPICGAPVAKDAPECDECGVQFEQPTQNQQPPKKTSEWIRGEREKNPPKAPKKKAPPQTTKQTPKKEAPKSQAPKPPAQQRRSTFQCPVCGKLLYVGAAKCPDCNVVFDSHGHAPSQPSRPERPAAPGIMFCPNCNFKIPPTDKFCRRCGSARPAGTGSATVSWQEYQSREHRGGLVSYDEYAGRN